MLWSEIRQTIDNICVIDFFFLYLAFHYFVSALKQSFKSVGRTPPQQ